MDILLVHGAWHGAWCWGPLQERLAAIGLRSVAIDLPGHGARRRPSWLTTWRAYAKAVHDAAAEFATPPLVVGHSMGGGVMTAAAELAPERFAALVYVAAFVPQDGESIGALARRTPALPGLRPRPLHGDIVVTAEAGRETFFHDCPDSEDWTRRLQPQPLRPTLTPVRTTPQRAGSRKRYYVYCRHDRALPLEFQQAMVEKAPMRRTFEMTTGHSPFLANPAELAGILAQVAAEVADS